VNESGISSNVFLLLSFCSSQGLISPPPEGRTWMCGHLEMVRHTTYMYVHTSSVLVSINVGCNGGVSPFAGRPFALELLNPHRARFNKAEVQQLQEVHTQRLCRVTHTQRLCRVTYTQCLLQGHTHSVSCRVTHTASLAGSHTHTHSISCRVTHTHRT
jgi:hypothetical protein